VEYASHSTCIAPPEAYLSFYESDDTYKKMAKDVTNMPHVKQYKSSVKRILHFMSQITFESGTTFTVYCGTFQICIASARVFKQKMLKKMPSLFTNFEDFIRFFKLFVKKNNKFWFHFNLDLHTINADIFLVVDVVL
jgi:hypothetical protein